MAAACSAAFFAPASPIAKVATGTPPGIWAMERSESRPFNARLSTGTPKTGKVVMLATMPGRCAAPPAPAMIAFNPRAPALLGIIGHAVGGTMGGHDAGLVTDTQRVQHMGGGLQGGPVRLAAHDDADGRSGDHASNCLIWAGSESGAV